jgi:hypothetical protein
MDDPDKAWTLVQGAILAFGSEVPDFARAREALLAVLSEGAWRSYLPPVGRRCEYDEFTQWVKERVPRGLDTTVENLREIAEGDTKLRDALDEATERGEGRPLGNKTVDNIHSFSRPSGTSETAALRRLRNGAPELHAEVLAGNLSAHAAMVKAGYRPKTVSVPVTRPEAVARSLLKYMSADDIAKLIAVLIGKDG